MPIPLPTTITQHPNTHIYIRPSLLLTFILASVTPCLRKKFLALRLPPSFILAICSGVHSSKSTDLRGRGGGYRQNDTIHQYFWNKSR